ncbi:MAG: exosortase-associated EpsI family protein [Isosphaeraceae bacterium]
MVWTRIAIVCALLVGSRMVQTWQDQRIQRGLEEGLRTKISLESVPLTLGPYSEWKGQSRQMDPEIARVTGADQIVTRRYTNSNTGVTVDVILLFGPARDMFIHAPTTCYPKAGFVAQLGPEGRVVKELPPLDRNPRFQPVPFAAVVYGKGEGNFQVLEEVYWTWRFNGRWSPQELAIKQIQRIASMVKIHTARRVLPGEVYNPEGNPSEALLRDLIPELEKVLGISQTPAGPPNAS